MIVREGNKNDINNLDFLMSEGDEYHRLNVPYKFKKSDESKDEYINNLLEDEKSIILVCENDHHIVGYVIVKIITTPNISILKPRNYGWIDALVVSEDNRRLGIGRKLMDEAEAWLKSRGIEEIELNVYNFNKGALALYEKLGYIDLSKKMIKKI